MKLFDRWEARWLALDQVDRTRWSVALNALLLVLLVIAGILAVL